MELTKSTWSDGKPAIEIASYDYSARGFNELCSTLESQLLLSRLSDPVAGLDTLIVQLQGDIGIVSLQMDHYTCSLAFETEDARNYAYSALKETAQPN